MLLRSIRVAGLDRGWSVLWGPSWGIDQWDQWINHRGIWWYYLGYRSLDTFSYLFCPPLSSVSHLHWKTASAASIMPLCAFQVHRVSPWYATSILAHSPQEKEGSLCKAQTVFIQVTTCRLRLYTVYPAWSQEHDRICFKCMYRYVRSQIMRCLDRLLL